MRNTRTPPRPRVPVAKDCAQPAVDQHTDEHRAPSPMQALEGRRTSKDEGIDFLF